ncbi:trimeric intracellular cation channel family protein [Myceligenerans sp. I2]|uniref:Trimeric intracellular cation channel family protein n=2 Tax=Myceligenerans indicum TaxID=2593663 RepID=A0ABS1LQU7_9MICO|nr:trimeric intracellular cation channel family protein [Myceligenerans indicum]
MDLAGVFFFAMSGSLLAARRGFDIVGSLMLGACVGLGGGILRDLIIDQGVPNAFASPVYLLPPVLATVLVYRFAASEHRYRNALTTFDAAGMALFCIGGTKIALAAGLNPVAAAVLGLISAVGGGVIRDVVANEDPQLFHPRGLYAIAALLGAGLTSAASSVGWLNAATGLAIAVLVFALRMLSLYYRWEIPLAGRTARRGEPVVTPR